jgi:hypothetical protein
MPNAKLGAKVDRYSFFVRLLPPLLHTGLARRTNIAIALISPKKGKQTAQAAHAVNDNDPCWLKNPPSAPGVQICPKAARIGVLSDGSEDTSAEVGQCCLSNASQTGGIF